MKYNSTLLQLGVSAVCSLAGQRLQSRPDPQCGLTHPFLPLLLPLLLVLELCHERLGRRAVTALRPQDQKTPSPLGLLMLPGPLELQDRLPEPLNLVAMCQQRLLSS